MKRDGIHMCNFIHLHVHSAENTFERGCNILDMCQKAKDEKMNAIALTDHHHLLGWISFANHTKNMKIKPIFGIELNVEKHHLTALATNEKGIQNIIHLNNLGYKKETNPYVTEKELYENREGILFLSGCGKGKLQHFIYERKHKEAVQLFYEYKYIFGDNFFLEIQNYLTEQHSYQMQALNLFAKQEKIPLIVTNDCHFVDKNEFDMYRNHLLVHSNGHIHAHNPHLYVKTTSEMERVFPSHILNWTQHINAKCEADFLSFLQKQQGHNEIPISVFYRYDDAESLRKALRFQKEYTLAEQMFKKIKKEQMKLEDVPAEGKLKEAVRFAYSLRNQLYKIEPDPYLYIKTTEHFPVYRKNKFTPYSGQIDVQHALQLGYVLYDRRKVRVFAK